VTDHADSNGSPISLSDDAVVTSDMTATIAATNKLSYAVQSKTATKEATKEELPV
jgi:hypothetical protein